MIFSLLLEGNPCKNIRFLSNFHRAKFAKFALLGFVADEANLTDIFTMLYTRLTEWHLNSLHLSQKRKFKAEI